MNEIKCENCKHYWAMDKDGKCMYHKLIVPADDWCPKFSAKVESDVRR